MTRLFPLPTNRTPRARPSRLLPAAAIACTLLASCSSGPPTEFLERDFARNGSRNIQVVRKVHCDSVSAEARALGIDDAWLVSFDYDSQARDAEGRIIHVSNRVQLYVKSDGNWYNAFRRYFLDNQCP